MREIILDTETTGLNASSGDRIVEIGCIELLNQVPTGNFFHTYVKHVGYGVRAIPYWRNQ